MINLVCFELSGLVIAVLSAAMVTGTLSENDMNETQVCAVCGVVSDPRTGGTGLRYQNLKTGARYCCEEHVSQDPDWSDDAIWIG